MLKLKSYVHNIAREVAMKLTGYPVETAGHFRRFEYVFNLTEDAMWKILAIDGEVGFHHNFTPITPEMKEKLEEMVRVEEEEFPTSEDLLWDNTVEVEEHAGMTSIQAAIGMRSR